MKETPDQLQSLSGVPLCIQITAFIGSRFSKLLTGTNTPFAISDPRMAAFLVLLSYQHPPIDGGFFMPVCAFGQ